MKLNKATVGKINLDPGKSDQIFYDDELKGFGLRIREGGSRKYILDYRLKGGIKRRFFVGDAAAMPADEARKKAAKAKVAVADGHDPSGERATRAAAAAQLVSSVIADYLEVAATKLKPGSLVETTRHLQKHWKPLHRLSLTAVNRQIVATHLRHLAKSSGPVACNRSRNSLSAMFGWAMREGLCEVNPVLNTNIAAENGPRERVLSDIELAAIWKATEGTNYGRIVRLIMLTACRRDEIGGLRWDEITLDGESPTIALPKTRTKNSVAHTVPLSAAAVAALKEHPVVVGHDWLFGTTPGGYGGWGRAKGVLNAACGITDWTLHDLRRTVRTGLGRLGVAPHVAEAILNHLPGKLIRTYDRNTYEAEKRAALDAWANHLMVAIAQADGANVHRLRKAGVK
jgi:integrase